MPLLTPPTASMVPIQIKMGSNGKIVYPGLKDLQNQTRAVNVDFTWIQAFRTHFGVSVDPERYSIRRHLAVRHHLREQIKILMGEYSRASSVFTVYLVEEPVTNVYKGDKNKNPLKRLEKTKVAENASVVKNLTRPTHQQMMTMPKIKPQTQITKVDMDQLGIKRPIQIQQRMNFIQNSARPTTTKFVRREETSFQSHQNHDFSDTASNCSQDSQIEELEIEMMGIPLENVKAPILHKVKQNIPNTQLIKAKQELSRLKTSNPSRWAKWTIYAPITANIIRDLLDV